MCVASVARPGLVAGRAVLLGRQPTCRLQSMPAKEILSGSGDQKRPGVTALAAKAFGFQLEEGEICSDLLGQVDKLSVSDPQPDSLMLLRPLRGLPQHSEHGKYGRLDVGALPKPGDEKEAPLGGCSQLMPRHVTTTDDTHVETPDIQRKALEKGGAIVPFVSGHDMTLLPQPIGQIGDDATPDRRADRTHE